MDNRFIVVLHEVDRGNTQILVDKVTGVNYLWHGNAQGGGLTVLLDKDGKPVVTPIEK